MGENRLRQRCPRIGAEGGVWYLCFESQYWKSAVPSGLHEMSRKAWKGGTGKGLSLEICKLCKGREEPREDCVSPPASFLTLLRAVSLACSSFPGKAGRSVRYGAGIVLGPQSYTICSITGP